MYEFAQRGYFSGCGALKISTASRPAAFADARGVELASRRALLCRVAAPFSPTTDGITLSTSRGRAGLRQSDGAWRVPAAQECSDPAVRKQHGVRRIVAVLSAWAAGLPVCVRPRFAGDQPPLKWSAAWHEALHLGAKLATTGRMTKRSTKALPANSSPKRPERATKRSLRIHGTIARQLGIAIISGRYAPGTFWKVKSSPANSSRCHERRIGKPCASWPPRA